MRALLQKNYFEIIALLLLFIFFFSLYQFSLFPNSSIFKSKKQDILFDGDHVEIMESEQGFILLNGHMRKHLLFPFIVFPLFFYIRIFYKLLGFYNWEIASIIFPFAFTGALSVIIFNFIISFLSSKGKNSYAFLFTCMYGFCFAKWFFSSFPETYSVTILFFNLFILLFLKYFISCKSEKMKYFALAHAILCLFSLQNLLLLFFVIPSLWYKYRLEEKKFNFLFFIKKCSIYIFIILGILFVAYFAIGMVSPAYSPFNMIDYALNDNLPTSASFYNFLYINNWLNVIVNLIFFSVLAVFTTPAYSDPMFYLSYFNHPISSLAIFLYLYILICSIRGYYSCAKKPWFIKSLLIAISGYICFFVYFCPDKAPFLNSSIFLTFWLLFLCFGITLKEWNNFHKGLFFLFLVFLVINNVIYFHYLNLLDFSMYFNFK